MQPRTKFFLLLLIWLVPYIGFVLYVSTQIVDNHIPTPYAYAMAAYFFSGLLVFSFLGPRIFRGAPPNPSKAQGAKFFGQAYGLWLVLVWSGLFLYGVYDTITGAIPWQRAVPAGILLLAFILLFGWNLLRVRRS